MVLEGKQYNLAVCLHQLMYEELLRLVWTGVVEWFETSHFEGLPKLSDTTGLVCEPNQKLYHAIHKTTLTSKSSKKSSDLFKDYLNVFQHERGSLTALWMIAFWMIYIDMVEILLGLLRADREGDWHLQLPCI